VPQHQRCALHYNKPNQFGQVGLANEYRMNAHIDERCCSPLPLRRSAFPSLLGRRDGVSRSRNPGGPAPPILRAIPELNPVSIAADHNLLKPSALHSSEPILEALWPCHGRVAGRVGRLRRRGRLRIARVATRAGVQPILMPSRRFFCSFCYASDRRQRSLWRGGIIGDEILSPYVRYGHSQSEVKCGRSTETPLRHQSNGLRCGNSAGGRTPLPVEPLL
jgi:hypothetical protein